MPTAERFCNSPLQEGLCFCFLICRISAFQPCVGVCVGVCARAHACDAPTLATAWVDKMSKASTTCLSQGVVCSSLCVQSCSCVLLRCSRSTTKCLGESFASPPAESGKKTAHRAASSSSWQFVLLSCCTARTNPIHFAGRISSKSFPIPKTTWRFPSKLIVCCDTPPLPSAGMHESQTATRVPASTRLPGSNSHGNWVNVLLHVSFNVGKVVAGCSALT